MRVLSRLCLLLLVAPAPSISSVALLTPPISRPVTMTLTCSSPARDKPARGADDATRHGVRAASRLHSEGGDRGRLEVCGQVRREDAVGRPARWV